MIAAEPADIRMVVHTMARQKTRRLRETGSPDVFGPELLSFCETMGVQHTGLVQTSALRVGEQIVATHWGMVFRRRFHYLVPAFEGGEWAKYSVGRVLLESLIEWCIDNRIDVFDLTVGNEPYKLEWADHSMTLYDLTCARTICGKLWWLLTATRQWGPYYLNRLIRRLRLHHLSAILPTVRRP